MAVLANGPDVPKKSTGLLGLSHFRNSRVSTSLWEPIYQNLFTVQMTVPRGMQDTTDDERMNIILEGVTSIGQYAFYNCTSLVNVGVTPLTSIPAEDAGTFELPTSVTSLGICNENIRCCSACWRYNGRLDIALRT